MPTTVKDNFFSIEECDRILSEIKDQKWQSYDDIDFECLGKCYLRFLRSEVSREKALKSLRVESKEQVSLEEYRHAVRSTNLSPAERKSLWDKYQSSSDVKTSAHDLLIERFSEMFPDVQYTKNFGKPGFQKWTTTEEEYWHYDNEKLLFPYEAEFPFYKGWVGYFDNMYTFTIMLSDGDFRYDYYPESEAKYTDMNINCNHKQSYVNGPCGHPACKLDKCETVEYKRGTLILCEGKQLHRPGKSVFKDSARISLQGHALLKNGTLYLYW